MTNTKKLFIVKPKTSYGEELCEGKLLEYSLNGISFYGSVVRTIPNYKCPARLVCETQSKFDEYISTVDPDVFEHVEFVPYVGTYTTIKNTDINQIIKFFEGMIDSTVYILMWVSESHAALLLPPDVTFWLKCQNPDMEIIEFHHYD